MAGGVNLGNAYGKIIIDSGPALSGIGLVQGSLIGLQSGFLGVNPVMGLFGAGSIAATKAVAGLTAVIGSSVAKAADLQAQMSDIQAVMGASSQEVGQLKTLIQDLGLDPNLKVSATEAADAIEMLGRNGLEVQDILDGAARATVLLTNATGGEFAQSADIATNVMALFNIEAGDMMQAVDGITSVVTNSQFSIDDYALALAQGGSAAATYGVSLDDFNTAIAGTASRFSGGSDAGTSFRAFLTRLVPTTNEATDMMRELGLYTGLTGDEMKDTQAKIAKIDSQIAKLDPTSKNYGNRLAELREKQDALKSSLQTGQNAFFKEGGEMKSMAEISGILNRALAGLTEEEKINALQTIFMTDGMRTAVGLAGYTKAEFEQLQATMGQTSAAEAARIRMDNFRGAMEILSGVVETVQLGIGDKFLPLLTELAQAASKFLSGNADQIVAFFGGIADGVAGAGPALEQFLGYVSNLLTAFQAGGLFGSRSGSFGSTGLLAALGIPPDIVSTIQSIFNGISAAIDAFETGGVFGALSAGVDAAWPAIQATLSKWGTQFWDWLTGPGGALEQAGTKLGEIGLAIQTQITQNWPAIQATLLNWGTQFWDWLTGPGGALEKAGTKLTELGTAIQTWVTTNQATLEDIGRSIGTILLDGLGLAVESSEKQNELAGKLAAALASAILGIAEAVTDIGVGIGQALIEGIVKKISGSEASEAVSGGIRGLMQGLAGAFNPLGQLKQIGDAFSGMEENVHLFRPGSPTPFEMGIRGITSALNAVPSLDQVFGGEPNVPNFADMFTLPNSLTLTALAAPATPAFAGAGGGNKFGDVIFYIDGAQSPLDTAKSVEQALRDLFDRANTGRKA